jgi:hypothetical protein
MPSLDWLTPFDHVATPIVSLYLSAPAGSNASARLGDLLRPVRELAENHGLPHDDAMSLRSAVKALLGMAPRLEVDPAPAVAVFAADGMVEYRQVDGSVWDVAMVGSAPYLRPLRVIPDPPRTGVAVTDRRRAEIFIKVGTTIQLVDRIEEAPGHKANYGGWHGLDEHRARNAAEEIARRHYELVAGRLFDLHKEDPLTWVTVGGHQEQVDEFVPHLHTYVKELLIDTFVVDPHTVTAPMVRERVELLERTTRQRDEVALVDQFLGSAGAGAPRARGLGEVLAAVNLKAVADLLVAGTFTREGAVCPCGWLGRIGDECRVCGGSPQRRDDIVAEAIERVLADGGVVRQLTAASPIDAMGVAATLRFPFPVSNL